MARGKGSDPPAVAGGSDLAASASTAGASTSSREERAEAPQPGPASPRGRRPPVPRRALRGGRGALIRRGQIWPRCLCLRRLSIGKRARERRGPAAGRSELDGSTSRCPSVSGGPRRKRARRAPVAAASADWCRLPEDLLVTVMGKLEVIDLVRAGAACSSWPAAFAAFRRLRLPSPKQPPCLLYSPRDGDPDVAVLSALSSSSSPRAPPTIRAALPGLPLSCRTFVGLGYGWLVTADEASNLHVVNPLTGAQLALPPLATLHNVDTSTGEGDDLTYQALSNLLVARELIATFTAVAARKTMYRRAVLSCSPSAGAACVVLLLHWPSGKLSFARLGDELWTPVSAAGLQRDGYRDALYDSDNGLFCVLRLDGKQDLPASSGDSDVYMVDLHGQKLEQITTSLGDHSLFLGYNNSMCISTKDLPMLEPNHAYLTDDCYQCMMDSSGVPGCLDGTAAISV
ncbi:hypothetical protein U9M48_041241 [Paspalum notatum var. saurae]|uniref:KIB1-4 beta-propeller domain-containing protein n=1 Tax=Paspalum notatum var. saurae TaxID=547442 RepID=A0AAQ3XD50_PASNO